MGATGAWVPAEIWQWVLGTRPDKSSILLKGKKCSKLDNEKPFKDEKHQIWGVYCKSKDFGGRDPTIDPTINPLIIH